MLQHMEKLGIHQLKILRRGQMDRLSQISSRKRGVNLRLHLGNPQRFHQIRPDHAVLKRLQL